MQPMIKVVMARENRNGSVLCHTHYHTSHLQMSNTSTWSLTHTRNAAGKHTLKTPTSLTFSFFSHSRLFLGTKNIWKSFLKCPPVSSSLCKKQTQISSSKML